MTLSHGLLEQFQQVGQDLFNAHLIGTHDGNLSLRSSDGFIITRHNAMKARLQQEDLVEISLTCIDDGLQEASTETLVHRQVYLETGAQAIVHAHPIDVIALSLKTESIELLDLEGSYLLGKVPVLPKNISSDESLKANAIASALKTAKIVAVQGHGTFSTGQDLYEAMHWTSSLASSCRIINLAMCE